MTCDWDLDRVGAERMEQVLMVSEKDTCRSTIGFLKERVAGDCLPQGVYPGKPDIERQAWWLISITGGRL